MNERIISANEDIRIPTKTVDETVEDDRIFEVPFFSGVCNKCIHKYKGPVRICKAFPQGIPMEIWTGENDHKTPFTGDMGIIFKRKKY